MEAKTESRIQFLFLFPALVVFCAFFLPLAGVSSFSIFRGAELFDLFRSYPEFVPPESGYGLLVSSFRLIPLAGALTLVLACADKRGLLYGILMAILVVILLIAYGSGYSLPLVPAVVLIVVSFLCVGRLTTTVFALITSLLTLVLALGLYFPGYEPLVSSANPEELGLPLPKPGLIEMWANGHVRYGFFLLIIAALVLLGYSLYFILTGGDGAFTVKIEERIAASVRQNIRQYMMIVALLGIWGIFYVLTENGIFMASRNLSNLFLQSASTAVVAIGVVLILVTLNIDLAIGSVVGFIGAIAAVVQTDSDAARWLAATLTSLGIPLDYGAIVAIVVALLIGLAVGAWHGMWIAYLGVPAFIVTLSSMMVFRGGILYFTGGKSIYNMYPWFQAIGQDYVSPGMSKVLTIIIAVLYVILDLRRRFVRQSYGFHVPSWPVQIVKLVVACAAIGIFFGIMIDYRGIPYAWLIVMVVMVIFTFIAEKTTFGRHLYAIGGNAEAARLSGINIKWKIMGMYLLMGIVTAIGGIIFLSRLNAATANAGNGMELDCIASAVIGGTSLLGGEGYIFGGVVGALVMGSLDNGMSLMNLDATWQYIVKGLVLLLAVWVDMMTRKRGN